MFAPHSNDTDENVKIDYNGLILTHLNRISFLTTAQQGTVIDPHGNLLRHNETDRYLAMMWADQFLDVLIPEPLRDKRFKEELEDAQEAWNEIKENKKNSLDNRAHNSIERIRACVNLLARKGFLFENSQAATLPKKKDREGF